MLALPTLSLGCVAEEIGDDALDEDPADTEAALVFDPDALAEEDDDALALAGDRGPLATTRGPGAHATIASGNGHACAVRRDGTVACWGDGSSGALGNGGFATSTVPVAVVGLSNVTAIGAGNSTTVALRSDGSVWRWGVRWGQAAHPLDATPQQVPGISGATVVAAGAYHACAVRSDGHVLCWGDGTLGDGFTGVSDLPVEVAGITNAIDVAVGGNDNTCALLASGSVKCWGDNQAGQLGDGTTNDAATPVTAAGITNAVDVAAEAGTTCIADTTGSVRCWGSNAGGMLGIGTLFPPNSLSPIPAAGVHTAVEVVVGRMQYVCARLADGTEQCWGRNDVGQIGNGDSGLGHVETLPASVSGLDRVVAITGGASPCALRSDGTARCWGSNVAGQLGNGTFADSSVPVVVSGLSSANDGPRIATGPYHTCGVRGDGTVKCWGDNSMGQLGNGNQTDQSTPVLVTGLSRVAGLAAGGTHTCALLDDGGVRCWGRNIAGELGDGGASGWLSTAPVAVSGLDDAIQIAASQQSSCALRVDGTAVCWGNNQYGQLGNGSFVGSNVPVAVTGLTNLTAIDMNNIHVCALTVGGGVKCWGYNFYGQLGNGGSGAGATSSTPVSVTYGGGLPLPLFNAVAIGVGNSHSCAALADGSARCWGAGFDGALGNGSFADRTHPVTVSSLTDAVDVSLGSSSTCALRAGGGVRCWGTNGFGELGHGAGPTTNVPGNVGVFPFYFGNGVTIDAGFDHTCVARGDGNISCWGLNDNGQLGDGTTTHRSTPVTVVGFP